MTPHLSIQDGNPMCQECGRNCNKHPRQWFAKQTDDDCNSISLAPKMSNKSKNATWTCPQWRSSAVEIAPPSHPNPLLDRGRSQQTSCFDIFCPRTLMFTYLFTYITKGCRGGHAEAGQAPLGLPQIRTSTR